MPDATLYTVTFRMTADGEWKTAQDPAPGYPAAMAHADALACVRYGVRVSDPSMLLAEWSCGTRQHIRTEAPGHPGDCSCGACAIRAAHFAGKHEGKICAHEVCELCAACEDCDYARGWLATVTSQQELTRRLLTALGDAESALREARTALQVLDQLDGVPLGRAGHVDITADLADAARATRSATRIGQAHEAEVSGELAALADGTAGRG
jgi:hypothetical protein